jgi:tetratricopeptide (TPR) repeat protein
MGKRNKKNRSMVNVFSDDEAVPDNQNETQNNTQNNTQNETQNNTQNRKNFNPFQLLDSSSEKEENDTEGEFIQVKRKEKPIKESIKVDPIKVDSIKKHSLYNKANQSAKLKNYDLAIKFYKESIETEKNPKAAYNLALLYDDLEQEDNVEIYYKIASEMGSNNANCNLAILLVEQKKYTESIPYFIKSIRNGEFDIIETYIECLSLMEKREDAFELLEKYKNYVNMNEEIKELFAKSVRLPFD